MAASLRLARSGIFAFPRLPAHLTQTQTRRFAGRWGPFQSLGEPWHVENAPAGLTGEEAVAWSSRSKAWCHSIGVTEDLIFGRTLLPDGEGLCEDQDRCEKCSGQSFTRILTRAEMAWEEEYTCLNPDCKHRWIEWN